MAGERVLILEDDQLLATVLTDRFGQEGWDVVAAGTIAAARAAFDRGEFDVALCDLRLPDGESLEVLREFLPRTPTLFVMMTAHATVASAVEALKLGAKDYLEKPFSLDRAVATVRHALELTALRREVAALRDRSSLAGSNVIGQSAAMRRVFALIERLATADAATVLIEGESGTGKGAIAQALHRLGRRSAGPFVNVTCAALPETLMESELFGHEKGAFTDAHSAKRGLVEMAAGGTLFLDEIGELTPGVQAKLLRFIEEKAFRRLGGTRDLTVDARIMTATNRDLAAEVAAGRFRADLFYRLRVVPIVLPPLRERQGDVPLLAMHFVTHFAAEFAKRIERITPEALAMLEAYAWPGNVRELRNVMERAVLLADGAVVDVSELPPEIAGRRAAATAGLPEGEPRGALDAAQRRLVAEALARANGNQSRAAAILGVSRHKLRNMMTRYGLAVAALLVALPEQAPAQAGITECVRCHADRELLARRTPAGHEPDSFLVDVAALRASAHAGLACVRCHPLASILPHVGRPQITVPCGTCHPAAEAAWHGGAHNGGGGRRGAPCAACHGDHDVASVAALREGPAREALAARCTACHPDHPLREGDVHRGRIGCADCHGSHQVLTAQAERAADDVSVRCTLCHQEVARQAVTDAHGLAVRRGAAHDGRRPSCEACHGGHGVLPAELLDTDSTLAGRCIACHEHEAESFAETYHGAAVRVGSKVAASCADCHGSHQVFGPDDPRSTISPRRLAATCGTCHEPARNAGLTSYRVHVERTSPEDSWIVFGAWVFMLLLIVGTIGFFGLHTLLWLTRTLIERAHQRRWRRAHGIAEPERHRFVLDSADRGKGPYIWRFTTPQRLAHGITVVAFFALTITGLPLRFSCAIWAPGLMKVIGGVTVAGLIHRVAGVILVVNLLAHVVQVSIRILRSPDRKSHLWGPDSLVPQPRDAVQMWQMMKYFLGRGPMPRFPRWSYMEKFDYFGSFWGIALLGTTGVVRWFPGLFAGWLPGWAFNVAAVFHAEEALLAASFLFLVHFFNVHLRPDKFPLDGVMWTGRARLEVLEEEHPAMTETWTDVAAKPVSTAPVADLPAPPPPHWLTITGAAFGIFAAAAGLVILGLILWVQLC